MEWAAPKPWSKYTAPVATHIKIFFCCFQGITQDLFPKKDVPSINRAELLSSLKAICAEKKLQATPYFTQKILQVQTQFKLNVGGI